MDKDTAKIKTVPAIRNTIEAAAINHSGSESKALAMRVKALIPKTKPVVKAKASPCVLSLLKAL